MPKVMEPTHKGLSGSSSSDFNRKQPINSDTSEAGTNSTSTDDYGSLPEGNVGKNKNRSNPHPLRTIRHKRRDFGIPRNTTQSPYFLQNILEATVLCASHPSLDMNRLYLDLYMNPRN